MAVHWGNWQYAGGNGMRVGIELVGQTPVYNWSTSVTFTFHLYTQNQYKYADNQTLHWTGALAGSAGFYNSSSGGAVHRQTLTWTYNYPAGQYGYTGSSYLVASISGAYNGVTPNVQFNFTLPPRPIAPPAAPSNGSSTRISDSTHQITWTRNASNAAPYHSQTVIIRSLGAGSYWSDWTPIATLSGSATSYTVPGLQPNRVYQYGVRANNSAGSSAYLHPPWLWNSPGAPANVTSFVNPSGNSITTGWDTTAYVTAPAVSFTIERSINAGASWTQVASGITAYSWTDPSPNNGPNLYRVRAVAPVGTAVSAWTQGNPVTTIVPPIAPSNLSPDGQALDFNFDQTFTWQHNHGGDGAPQSEYRLEVSSDGGSSWTVLANDVASANSSHLVPAGTLANGVDYVWRVRTLGVASGGWGPWSTLATVTGSSTPTATITAPTAYITAMPIQVDWVYNQDELSPQAWYRVRLLDPDTGQVLEVREENSSTPSTTFEHMGEDGDRFRIEVQVRSAEGVLSPVTFEVVEVALPVPALIDVDPEYQECTGTVRLGLTPTEPLEAPDDITNLVRNPGFRATSGLVEVDRNLARNPSFGGNLTGTWALSGAGNIAQVPNPSLYGNESLRVIPSSPLLLGVDQTVNVTVGQQYTLSAWLYITPGAEEAAPRVAVTGVGGGSPVTVAGTWVRSVYTFTASASSHTIQALQVSGAAAVGRAIYVDGVMLNEGASPVDFFDGDSADDGEFTYEWGGSQYSTLSRRWGRSVWRSFAGNYPPVIGWQGADGASQVLRVPREFRPDPVIAYGFSSSFETSGLTTAERYTVSVKMSAQGADVPAPVTVALFGLPTSGSGVLLGQAGPIDLPADGSEVEIRFTSSTPPPGPDVKLRTEIYAHQVTDDPSALPDTFTVREALIVPVPDYDGPYFDGDSPNTSTAIHSWTGTPDDSPSVAEGRAETTVVSASIQRRINGGPWVTLVRDLPLANTFIDVVPSTAGLNEYRVIGADAAPSYRSQPIVAVPGTDGDRGGPLWAFLSYGPGFSRILRIRGDLSVTETASRTRGVQAVQGRRLPVLLAGQNRSRGLSISGTAHYRDECREVGPEDCEHDSPLTDWVEAGLEADLVCFRDYTGRRLFGTIGDVQVSEYALGHANVSFPVTATDYSENYGIASPEVI